MTNKFFLMAIAGAIIFAAIGQILNPTIPRVIYNKSDSAPHGWYQIDPDAEIKTGVMVAAFAPKKARNLADKRGYLPRNVPMLKTVYAETGTEICVVEDGVLIPNYPVLPRAAQDSLGRKLPAWDGCITLKEDEVFLWSTHVQTSFDSRYFGAVPTKNILGTAEYTGKGYVGTGVSGDNNGRARDERQ